MNPIQEALKERLSSPIIGSFFISWVLWNWKIIIFVFSGLEPQIKIDNILSLLSPYLSFIYPFLTMLAYVFILPIINHYYGQYQNYRERLDELRDIRNKAISEIYKTYNSNASEVFRLLNHAIGRMEQLHRQNFNTVQNLTVHYSSEQEHRLLMRNMEMQDKENKDLLANAAEILQISQFHNVSSSNSLVVRLGEIKKINEKLIKIISSKRKPKIL